MKEVILGTLGFLMVFVAFVRLVQGDADAAMGYAAYAMACGAWLAAEQ